MSKVRVFEIRLQGTREGRELEPASLDIDELIEIMQNGRNLLYPDGKKKEKVGVSFTKGSVLVSFLTLAGRVIEVQALMEEVEKTRELDFLAPKQRDAIGYFQKIASQEIQIELGAANTPSQKRLHINRDTASNWKKPIPVWVDAELYLTGKITNVGGKSNPNIHLDTNDYDLTTVIISASEEQLASDKKNRLYKKQQVRVSIKQDIESGQYDAKTAQLLEFIDLPDTDETDEEYLDRLIREASDAWSDVKDSEAWLNEIRGYGN